MEIEIKKKEQTMMCVEKLKLNNVRNKKLKSQTVSKKLKENKRNNSNSVSCNYCSIINISRNNNKFGV